MSGASKVTHKSIFDGKYYCLDACWGGHDKTIVTFDYWGNDRHPTEIRNLSPGFGRGAFVPFGINEFIVRTRVNDWYQGNEMDKIIDMILGYGHDIVATYGVSMGGYAAVNFSNRLYSNKFVAFSPQYSIDPSLVSGDERYKFEFSILKDMKNNHIHNGECANKSGYVFFDKTTHDSIHAALIKNKTSATLVPFEYGGHDILVYLQKIYPLKKLVLDIFDSSFCETACGSLINCSKYKFANYAMDEITDLSSFELFLNKLKNKELYYWSASLVPIVQKAIDAGIQNENIISLLDVFESVFSGPPFLVQKVTALKLLGQIGEAIEICEKLVQECDTPMGHLQSMLFELLMSLNEYDKAESLCKKTINQTDKKFHSRQMLIQVYLETNQIDHAISTALEILDNDGESSSIYLLLADLYSTANNVATAEKYSLMAREINSKTAGE